MRFKLYNTLSREKEVFEPLEKGHVRYYTCGPTVHNYAHIGNFRTFVVQDVLKRWMEQLGFRVNHVMNITDIDEKTMERSARKKIDLSELTKKYEKAFFKDLKCLNIKPADAYPRVSDNIPLIAEMAQGLYKKGHAIIDSDGSYYFDINTFEAYGELSGKRLQRKIRAKMPREDYKTPKNFLLWKRCIDDEKGSCWDSIIGKGIPGWHIECAAIAGKYLGQSIDIHSGGVDLIFPHHENEIAEAQGYTDKKFSNYWVHVEHLLVYGKKMSKSIGNFFTVPQIIRKGYDPRALRILYLKTHYRTNLDFDFKKLQKATDEISLVIKQVTDLDNYNGQGKKNLSTDVREFKVKFLTIMNNDLDTPKAWNLFIGFIKDIQKNKASQTLSKKGARNVLDLINYVDSVFGFMGECK